MNKRTKIIIAVVGFILLITLSGNYILKGVFSKVIDDLNTNKDFPIHIKYRKTRFNIYNGSFKIFDAEVTIKNSKTKPQLSIEVGAIDISGLNIFKALNNNFSINDLIIENPTVCLYNLEKYDAPPDKPKKKKGEFPHFVWHELKLIRGTFKNYKVVEGDTTLETQITGINLNFSENQINSIDDLLRKGEFSLDALSLDVGYRSKLYVKNSFFNLKDKRVVFRDMVYQNDERHTRYFKSLEYKSLWKYIKLDSLEILGFSFIDTVHHKQLAIDSIIVFAPNILLKSKESLPKNPDAKKLNLANIFPSDLDIHHILVKNGNLEYRNYLKGVNKYKSVTIDTINVHLNRVDYAYAEGNPGVNNHPLGRGKVVLKNFKAGLKYPNELTFREVAIDFDKDNLLVKNIFLNNKSNPVKLIAKQSFKEDWNELKVSSVSVLGFNLQKYLNTDSLLISHVKIQNALLDTRNAGDLKRRPTRVGKLMHHWFRSLPGYNDVRDIKIVNSEVLFRMYFEKATKNGLMDIKNITASVDRITNIDKSVTTHVNGRGSYLGKNNLSLYVKLKVYDQDFRFHVKATARNINLPDINTLIKPMLITFKKGHMYLLQIEYSSEGLMANATGTVLFNYDGLEIEVLKKDKKINKQKTRNPNKGADLSESSWILSSAANLVAKTENMPGRDGYVVGKFQYTRKSYQGFFGHLVGSMAKGAQKSLINKKDKDKVRAEKKLKKEEKKKHRLERKKSGESLKFFSK